jgi:hypothetical protein
MQCCGLDSSGSGDGALAGFCEHGDDLLCCKRYGKFLDSVTGYQMLKKDHEVII